jgi:hypothetical protein
LFIIIGIDEVVHFVFGRLFVQRVGVHGMAVVFDEASGMSSWCCEIGLDGFTKGGR